MLSDLSLGTEDQEECFSNQEEVDTRMVLHSVILKSQYTRAIIRTDDIDVATTTDKSATQLPQTEDAFKEHASRERYQAVIWCHSHLSKPQLDAPEDCGWYRDYSGLQPCHVHKGICSC